MNKIKEILDWYNQFNNTDIVIKTKTKEFNFEIRNKYLPHLLGLQYSSINKLRGVRLYSFVYNKTEKELYNLIKINNENRLEDVKLRINNFKYFMENLDKAIIYEKTNETTKTKSNFLMVKTEKNKYLQLGVVKNDDLTDYLETFFVRKDNLYFKNSNLSEKVESIEKYDMLKNKFVPFSFDEIKNEMLNSVEYGLNENENIKLPPDWPDCSASSEASTACARGRAHRHARRADVREGGSSQSARRAAARQRCAH